MKISALVIVLVAALSAALPAAWQTEGGDAATRASSVVFLVRHAEKAGEGADRDPALSPEGAERAEQLARLLRDAGIERVHSTDYRRTQQTAKPVADALALSVESYDPRDPSALLRELRSSAGRHLIVGHSNTTPALVELLGGQAGAPIAEDEYDRIYVVTLAPDQPPSTVLLHYGAGG